MVEVNKEIYKDVKMFEREDLEIRMDFVRFRSPFINLKSKSRNYATQENYEQSEECKRWENFCCDCTPPLWGRGEHDNIIKFTGKNKQDIAKARFYVIYST